MQKGGSKPYKLPYHKLPLKETPSKTTRIPREKDNKTTRKLYNLVRGGWQPVLRASGQHRQAMLHPKSYREHCTPEGKARSQTESPPRLRKAQGTYGPGGNRLTRNSSASSLACGSQAVNKSLGINKFPHPCPCPFTFSSLV
eukprot:1604473-Amphidinium_carterae.1